MQTITIDKYNSQTGQGTLSYYARKYGTTVDALAKENNIQNPDLIYAGNTLKIPSSNSPIQTTAGYRAETNQRIENFNNKYAQPPASSSPTTTTSSTTNGSTNNLDPFAGLDEDQKAIRTSATLKVKELETTFSRMQKFADQAHNDLLNATRQVYEGRLAQMADANSRLLETKRVSNIRGGRDRYAPELAQGILTDEEQQGQERLLRIEAEMLMAVAQANSAKEEGDMKRFNMSYDKIEAVRKEMEKTIADNYKLALDRDKAIRDNQKALRDEEKANFDMSLKRAKTAAPGIAEQLMKYGSDQERALFLQLYSERTGIDLDIIMGEVATASQDAKYKGLQIQNIQNQIKNRDSSNALAWSREARLKTETDAKKLADKEKAEKLPATVENILAGRSMFDDTVSTKDNEETKRILASYGLFETEPPQWYKFQYSEDALAAGATHVTPQDIQASWEEYRRSRGII